MSIEVQFKSIGFGGIFKVSFFSEINHQILKSTRLQLDFYKILSGFYPAYQMVKTIFLS